MMNSPIRVLRVRVEISSRDSQDSENRTGNKLPGPKYTTLEPSAPSPRLKTFAKAHFKNAPAAGFLMAGREKASPPQRLAATTSCGQVFRGEMPPQEEDHHDRVACQTHPGGPPIPQGPGRPPGAGR